MQIARTIDQVRAAVHQARSAGASIGFVPTMGALHAGHGALLAAAKAAADWTVASIFVNPAQFGPNEDFALYPRDEAGDLAFCAAAGVELVFLPAVDTLYSAGAATSIHVARLTETLCGPHRPGHFDGVALIVAKLFNIVRPDRAYFGEKDAQQLAVIRRLVRDLDFPVQIVGCPTQREPDGLALSSRNRTLSPAERRQAAGLVRALEAVRAAVQAGARDAAALEADLRRRIAADAQPTRIEYACVVDADDLQPVTIVERPVLIALAAWYGRTRLIDNLRVAPDSAATGDSA